MRAHPVIVAGLYKDIHLTACSPDRNKDSFKRRLAVLGIVSHRARAAYVFVIYPQFVCRIDFGDIQRERAGIVCDDRQ